LAVLSADQLAAVAADPSNVGDVVVSDAVISFVPSPTQFDVPDASPQAMGTITAETGPITVMGQSFPDTDWSVHAFQVLDGGRLLYLGAVNDSNGDGIWTVADAIAAAPPEADSLLYAVSGWLLQTAAAPCVAPPDFSSSQDYWCGGSWLLPDEPAPPTDGTIHLQYPGSIHIQWSAYSDFAENPQTNGGLGGDPRLGTYLIRPAGCPPNVMGDCPVWEMVGRLSPTMTSVALTPTAEPIVSGTASTAVSPRGTRLALETDPPSVFGNGCMTALLLPVRVAHTGDHLQFLWATGGSSDGTEARIVWPAGFSAWLVNGRAELREPDGQVVAVDGDVLNNLGGGGAGDDRLHVCSIGDQIY
jgi:hypothetical protein